MKNKMISLLLAAALMIGLLAGCGSTPAPGTTVPTTVPATTAAPETTAPQAELPDLETLYNQGMEVLSQMCEEAPILFPETDVNYLDNFYQGLAAVELKQLYAGVAPVTNAPFEIILVEVANEADVQTVLDIFQARVDRECGDTAYPENAEAWMNECRITSRGNYVFLAVLMGSAEIPSQFILD
jgi:hypothetical protein